MRDHHSATLCGQRRAGVPWGLWVIGAAGWGSKHHCGHHQCLRGWAAGGSTPDMIHPNYKEVTCHRGEEVPLRRKCSRVAPLCGVSVDSERNTCGLYKGTAIPIQSWTRSHPVVWIKWVQEIGPGLCLSPGCFCPRGSRTPTSLSLLVEEDRETKHRLDEEAKRPQKAEVGPGDGTLWEEA